jgi:hypothetical protein
VRLAEENKLRISKNLEDSKQLKKDLYAETLFSQRVFASVVVSTIVGGATAFITKNKRNSVITSLAALAASFIIE